MARCVRVWPCMTKTFGFSFWVFVFDSSQSPGPATFMLFSAFWLWSSVVSVLISVTTDIHSLNGTLSTNLWDGAMFSQLAEDSPSCPRSCTTALRRRPSGTLSPPPFKHPTLNILRIPINHTYEYHLKSQWDDTTQCFLAYPCLPSARPLHNTSGMPNRVPAAAGISFCGQNRFPRLATVERNVSATPICRLGAASFGHHPGVLSVCFSVCMPPVITHRCVQKMAYVDLGWPLGLVLLGVNGLYYGQGLWLRRVIVCGCMIMHGGRMFLGIYTNCDLYAFAVCHR